MKTPGIAITENKEHYAVGRDRSWFLVTDEPCTRLVTWYYRIESSGVPISGKVVAFLPLQFCVGIRHRVEKEKP